MSGTSYFNNKSISTDIEDIKRIQMQRNKLEKISVDYKSKGYRLETLSQENEKLKAALKAMQRESQAIGAGISIDLRDIETDRHIADNEAAVVTGELDRYRIYAGELEKNNGSWKKESSRQADALEGLVDEAEGLTLKIRELEDELRVRREEQNKTKLEQQGYIKLKHSLDRQRHNYEIIENDYNTFKKQNEDLRDYIAGLEEDRIRNEVLLERMEDEKEKNEDEIEREASTLAHELETQRAIAENQENFIDELRVEIDQLKKQNKYLKSKLELLE